MKSKTIRVRAADGRVVVFPQGTVAGGGRTNLRLTGPGLELDGATPGELEVPLDAFVRGRLRAGDLVEVSAEVAPEASPEPETPRRRASDQETAAAEPTQNMRAPTAPNLGAGKKG